MRIASVVCAVALSLLSAVPSSASTEITYHGQLRVNSLPVSGSYDFQFGLFDAVTAGSLVSGVVSVSGVTVTNGLFTAQLDFGVMAFPGTDRWIELYVRPAGSGSYTTLAPRQKMTYAPYALALPNLRTEASQNTSLYLSANVIGGSTANTMANGVTGSVIAGGGATNGFPQVINAFYSAIGGGYSNTIGVNGQQSVIAGGIGNSATANTVAIGGGWSNTASGSYSTIAGGLSNTASGLDSAIAGGTGNTASGLNSAIAGGASNTASGGNSAVPGGQSNTAGGSTSFAAGNRAKALNAGSFVWGDSTGADVTSTVNDQFTVRANGGVVVNTAANVALNASAGVALSVNAGGAAAVPIGTLYKDNTVVAWGRVLSNVLDSSFNVQSFLHNSAGNYTITLSTAFSSADTLIPVVTASYSSAPTGTATLRFAGAGPFVISNSSFNVYTNSTSGAGTQVDSDFTFIVTGR